MESLTASYNTLDGEEVTFGFTRDIKSYPGGKEIIICDHEKYEMRLLRVDSTPAPGRNSKVLFNAQITSKANGITIHAPVIVVTGGDHSGAIMIGRTANYRKHRALLSKYIDSNKIFDEVTIPYSEYMIMESMLRSCRDQN